MAHGVTQTALSWAKLAAANDVAGKTFIHYRQKSISCLRKHKAYYSENTMSLANHTFSDRLSCASTRSADPCARIASIIAPHDNCIKSTLCPRPINVVVGRKSKVWVFQLGYPESVSAQLVPNIVRDIQHG